ncbi:hypothetical protein CQ020_14330 [Arthrobacter sp. MYb23]|uniref:hypothetical protein n=1 Tax=unclassified Arthrobacter TaxID=235627 RepID=UPI000CFAAB11|nr:MULTISPECIES: hypothetical protein [unclassified Arthrobacter]PRB41075.1 hypothetical protein CQ038_14845 [Arthrobacter sp. MYb51]PRB94745.1 hypothetical protein CQ020_14330 [Arthrobacter sp. MYb23]
MRSVPVIATGATLLLALSSCSSPAEPDDAPVPSPTNPSSTLAASPTTKTVACPPLPIDVTITYELVIDARGGVTINAASNLPDGAELNSSFFTETGFFAQDEGVLEKGKVTFGPFSDKATPLHGNYDMSITLPIARNQPAEIRACIGKAGENLTGPLVSIEEITGDKVASVSVRVNIS